MRKSITRMKIAQTLTYFVLILLSSGEFSEAAFLSWWETGLKYNQAPGQNDPVVFYGLLREINLQECSYLVKDYGTSQSPKSTRLRDNLLLPGPRCDRALRHTFVSLGAGTAALSQVASVAPTFDQSVYDRTNNEKVILIGYSLGAGMAKGYLMGMRYSNCSSCDAQFDPQLERLDSIQAVISIVGGNYGLQVRGVTTPDITEDRYF